MLKPWSDDRLAANGRAVRENFTDWFGDSKIIGIDGAPLVVYHSTYSDFTTPKVNFGRDEWKQFGMHIGSLEAATTRIELKALEDKTNRESSGNAGANIMPIYVRIKNPLQLTENRSGRWGVDDVFGQIVKQAEAGDPALGWISPEFIDDFYNDANVFDDVNGEVNDDAKIWQNPEDWNDGERTKALVDWLETAGIDGIVYKNEFEGGGDSYIVFKPTQLKSAIANNGLYRKDNSSLTDDGDKLALRHVQQARVVIEEMTKKNEQKAALC